MLYIVVMLLFFFDAVLIHLLVCRRSRQEGLFLKNFIAIAGVNLGVCWLVFLWLLHRSAGAPGVWFVPLVWTSTIFYILLIPTYLVFYFSTQQTSPSKKIMLLLCEGDMTRAQLSAKFRDDELITPRIDDLATTGCIRDRNGTYALTFSGLQMARVYALYQAVLGRRKGG